MKRGKTTKNDVTEETECGQGVAQVAGGSSGIWNLESGIWNLESRRKMEQHVEAHV